MKQDFSNTNAAKKRLCCMCIKYCLQNEISFKDLFKVLNYYILQDWFLQKKYFVRHIESDELIETIN